MRGLQTVAGIEEALALEFQYDAVGADFTQQQLIGTLVALDHARVVEDHEALRRIDGIHVHAQAQIGQRLAYAE